ncbi:MAG: bifunctional diaminohydroxyphosphoribosylaminopyrimidine deaminase/5-amino-6-(5-phosphoribosylamino)uracil reductase RibD [Vulcanimicrobiota bacterium]
MDRPLANQQYHMQRAMQLAAGGLGRTSPNPVVGAVIVNQDKVVGEGLHLQAGDPHAEVFALREAEEQARGATMYVTLEPCCVEGRTPPCVPQLVEAGIKKVVVGLIDPDPRVQGRGLKQLREAGIEVELVEDDLQEACAELNRGFIKRISAGRPYVTMKFAASLDGKIATHTGDSKYITGPEARRWVHRERDDHDAIMVGINTVLKDDPLLTSRNPSGRTPTKIIVDSRGRLPAESKLFDDIENGVIVLTTRSGAANLKAREGQRVIVSEDEDGRVNLVKSLQILGKIGFNTVFLEGGSRLNGSMLDLGLIDRVAGFVAPVLLGGESAPSPVSGQGMSRVTDGLKLRDVGWTALGSDLLIEGYLWKPTDVLELPAQV